MMFTSLDELNGVLMRHPMSNYGRLRLDHYLVLRADNEETENYLTSLEERDILPLTAAWFSQEAWKVRLYQWAEGISPGEVFFSDLIMSVRTGADDMCLVASPLNRLRDYDDLGDESLLEDEPAALSEQGLKILTSLLFLSDCLWAEDHQPI
jgi:hypothetical protein